MQKIQHSVEQLSNQIGYTATAVATGGGLMTYLNENANAVGAIVAICGLVVAMIGLAANIYFQRKRTKLGIK